MATVTATLAYSGPRHDNNLLVSWAGLAATTTSVGSVVSGFARCSDRTVHIYGNFGGSTVALHGSLDGTTYTVLTDPQGNAISKTSASIESIEELVDFIKPVVAVDGTATGTISVVVLAKGVSP